MLLLKTGVQPKLAYILAAVANEAASLPFDVVITACINGEHDPNSKHYMLAAADVRSKNFPSEAAKTVFLNAVLARLGPDYAGFVEQAGTPNEHFHVQYGHR